MSVIVDTRPVPDEETYVERTVYADGRLRVDLVTMLADPQDRWHEPDGGWDAWERNESAPELVERTAQEIAKCPHKVRLTVWAGPDFRSPTLSTKRVCPTEAAALAAAGRALEALSYLGFDGCQAGFAPDEF